MGGPVPGDRKVEVPQPRAGAGAARPSTSGPRQLPIVPAHFTNRAEEVRLLDKLIERERDTPAIQLISGQGGIGKTALATSWGHSVSWRFPHGQLHADLGGYSTTGPLATSEVLGRFLRALGVPPNGLPGDPDELANLYRTVTADKPLLVFLDNARTSDQVRPLIPASADSLVIVTSRRTLGTLQSEHLVNLVQLDPFNSAHGAELLTRTIGENRVNAETEHAEVIVRLCSGLPIALSTISAKLAAKPRMPLAKVASELQLEHRRLAVLTKEATSVQASFNLSYDALPPDAAALYAALGLHPGPDFGVGVAAASIGKSTEAAEDLLDQLVDDGLLIDVHGDGERFTFHDLARLHAKEKTAGHENERDREIAIRRMLEWYLYAASATADLTVADQKPIEYTYEYRPKTRVTFASREESLAWLELERANLIAAVETAYEQQLYELGWQLAAAMWPLFLLHKHYPDFLRVSQLGVKCASRWGNHSAEALMHNRSGAATRGTGRFDDAVGHYRSGYETATAANDQVVAIRSVEGLGLVALAKERVDDAIEAFTENLRMSRDQERAHDVGLALINLGATLTKAERPAEAIVRLEEASALLTEQGDEYNDARARIELGRALALTGEFAAAREELGKAQAVMRARGSKFEEARTLQALGEVAETAGDVDEAKRLYDQALPILVGLGRPEADALRNRLAGL
ncbi:NB-ARC domain-containing protein [Amycolatopsis xylanica]|uniref:NB-ARC domain-containing protein n=1 Tax=Amycolatopsis xylanica TaxID=589385 RepID=A0A1H3B388_9PSEU|nr:tetratricopeptide repeat protein [Amycolatopsis xylanica]SDX35529.1 NB-ARC domain-containing protein [Amycolatopsis xylanica]